METYERKRSCTLEGRELDLAFGEHSIEFLRDEVQLHNTINLEVANEYFGFRKEPEPYEESVDDEGKKCWIEYIDGQKVIRNNNDPSLTHDGIPTIETQLKGLHEVDNLFRQEMEMETEEQKAKRKEINLALKVKCIILDELGLDILSDTRYLNEKQRKLYNNKFKAYYENADEEYICNKFFEVCHETIFAHGVDFSKYPVYKVEALN